MVVTSSPEESGKFLVLLVEVGLEEGVVVAAGDEADLLGVGLGGDGEAGFGGHLADVGLLHLAEGEEGAGELILRETEEEIRLVLGLVGGAGEDPALSLLVKMIPRIVPGGDAVGADLAGGDEELVELEVVVAEGAGDGGAAGEVFADEGLDDFGFEAVLLVDDVVGDVELLGYVAGVVDVVDAAAAALNGLGHAFVSGEAALVPELEGEADDGRGPAARRSAATAEESTPPDMATAIVLLGSVAIVFWWGSPSPLISCKV